MCVYLTPGLRPAAVAAYAAAAAIVAIVASDEPPDIDDLIDDIICPRTPRRRCEDDCAITYNNWEWFTYDDYLECLAQCGGEHPQHPLN